MLPPPRETDVSSWCLFLKNHNHEITDSKENSSFSRRQKSHVENAGPQESKSKFLPLVHISLRTQHIPMGCWLLNWQEKTGLEVALKQLPLPQPRYQHSTIWLCTNIGEANTISLNKRKEPGGNLGFCQFCSSWKKKKWICLGSVWLGFRDLKREM